MGKDACEVCGCCNHCNSRHEDSELPLESCSLDPDTPQEFIEKYLSDAGCDTEGGLRELRTMLNLLEKNTELARELIKDKLEIGRLQETLFALSLEPWVGVAPGLESYVKCQLVSGRVSLSGSELYQLRLHLEHKHTDKT